MAVDQVTHTSAKGAKFCDKSSCPPALQERD